MRRIFVFFVLTILFSAFLPQPVEAEALEVLIVKIKDEADVAKLNSWGEGMEAVYDKVYRLKVRDSRFANRDLERQDWVEFVDEDAILRTTINASDPLFVLDQQELSKQWYLPRLQIHQAWERTTGGAITVAVVDTGIDAKHEDLNDGRVGKGYLSYCQVMSQTVANECLVKVTGELAAGVNSDDNGHGTIVAGIIGAIANNNRGMAGINWNIRLMPIKALDANGSGLASDVSAGIRWAADNGAKIINLSIGGPGLNGIEVLQDAISYAFAKGVLIVAAAGNDAAVDGGNLNTNPVLPVCADRGENMVIGVAAVDHNDRKARFSNYGSNCLDISAPGTGTFIDKQQKQGLVSTYYDPTRPGEHDLYVYAVGTSVAAPMVSGVAALMMSAFPDLDVKAIRDRLIASVDNIDAVNTAGCNGGSCVGQIGRGRLNALKAVTIATTFAPGALVRDSSGTTYLIERGLKRPISEFVFKQRFSGTTTVNGTAEQLATYPTGSWVPPVDSTTIKEPASPTVYLVEGGERRAMSYLSFISRNLRFENVLTLPAVEVASYPQGSDASVLNGALMKTPDHPAVFILNDGVRQLLSFFVYEQRGYINLPIGLLSLEELAQYPTHVQGYLYPPVEGTLIRGDLVATVYVVLEGKRRGLNLPAFQNRGYRFADVKVLPQSEVEGYELGADILE